MKDTENDNHCLLRGGSREGSSYSHGYSSSQLKVLASMCEALIPPLPNQNPPHKSLQSFYQASESQSPTPDEIAEMVVNRALPQAASLVSSVVKILSFRLGTSLLCGFICFDWKWPFLHKFSVMSLEKREQALKR